MPSDPASPLLSDRPKAPKPTLCLDFDGVIHRYSSGWLDGRIYDHVTEGFFEWAQEAKEHFRLVIYSTRSESLAGVASMHEWLYRQWLAWKASYPGRPSLYVSDPLSTAAQRMDFEFASTKPKAFLQIDDRAIQFQGAWNDPWLDPEQLLKFQPWNQRTPQTQE